jgi:glucose dehydrogenase
MAGAATPAGAAAVAANVDAARIDKADQDASNWLTYGRTYSEQRFSPLQKITAANAAQLGQYAPYTTLELQMWRQGSRRNSPEAMRLFAGKLDDSEVAALAAYYEEAGGSAAAPPAASVN